MRSVARRRRAKKKTDDLFLGNGAKTCKESSKSGRGGQFKPNSLPPVQLQLYLILLYIVSVKMYNIFCTVFKTYLLGFLAKKE